MSELKIIFPDEQTRELFATWMSDGGGEQQYFEVLRNEDQGQSWRMSYHPENPAFERDDKRRYGKFLEDGTMRLAKLEDEAP